MNIGNTQGDLLTLKDQGIPPPPPSKSLRTPPGGAPYGKIYRAFFFLGSQPRVCRVAAAPWAKMCRPVGTMWGGGRSFVAPLQGFFFFGS